MLWQSPLVILITRAFCGQSSMDYVHGFMLFIMPLYTKVFINGTFDILHSGHLKLFRAAKDLGGFLHVCVDSDGRVQKLKGANRPINTLHKRMEMLESIRYIDEVSAFASDADLEWRIRKVSPDLMIKGADYINKPIVGAHLVPKIIFIDLTDDSTTKIISSIINR